MRLDDIDKRMAEGLQTLDWLLHDDETNVNGFASRQTVQNRRIKAMASNKTLVPEAKEAMERFKMEAANEVGVNLKQGYNGDITAKQAGSVGGQMVNNMNPVRTMRFERHNRISQGHKITVKYAFSLTV